MSAPELLDWNKFDHFSFSKGAQTRRFELRLSEYLSSRRSPVDIDRLKKDKVYLFADGGTTPVERWPVYRCLVFETTHDRARYVLARGEWFEVDARFAKRVREALRRIPVVDLKLPKARLRNDGKIETEGDYNKRAARARANLLLMDRKLARCEATSSDIELCDLLSKASPRRLIHVKPRKGGSSTLSHLFAQGRIAAEALTERASPTATTRFNYYTFVYP